MAAAAAAKSAAEPLDAMIRSAACALPALVATIPSVNEASALTRALVQLGATASYGSLEHSRSAAVWALVLLSFEGLRFIVRWPASAALVKECGGAAVVCGGAPSCLDDEAGIRLCAVTMDVEGVAARWGSAGLETGAAELLSARSSDDRDAMGLVSVKRASAAGKRPETASERRRRKDRPLLSATVRDPVSGLTLSVHQCGVGKALPLVARPVAGEAQAGAAQSSAADQAADAATATGAAATSAAGGTTAAASTDSADVGSGVGSGEGGAARPSTEPAGAQGSPGQAKASALPAEEATEVSADRRVSLTVLRAAMGDERMPAASAKDATAAAPAKDSPAAGSFFGLLVRARNPTLAARAWSVLLGPAAFSFQPGSGTPPFGWPVATSPALVIAFAPETGGGRPAVQLLFLPPKGTLAAATAMLTSKVSGQWVVEKDATVHDETAGVRSLLPGTAESLEGRVSAGLIYFRSPGIFGSPDDNACQRVGYFLATLVGLVLLFTLAFAWRRSHAGGLPGTEL